MNSFSHFFFCVIILHFSLKSTTVYGSSFKGCWKEHARHRHFQVTIGNYNPETLTPERCQGWCGLFDYEFAATTWGKFCFCSKTLPSGPTVGNNKCSIPCIGDRAKKCGGKSYVGVYTSTIPVQGLEMTVTDEVIEAPAVVNVTASIKKGSFPLFQADYGDGAGFSEYEETGFLQHELYLPGTYQVSVVASDKFGSSGTAKDTSSVRLEERPQDAHIECNPVFGTYKEGHCLVTVWRGSNLKLEVDITNKSYANFMMNITDPRLELTGMWSPFPNGTGNSEDTPRSILLVGTSVETEGKLYGLKVHVNRTGLVNFMLLTPKCTTGTYCLSTNKCEKGACASLYTRIDIFCNATAPSNDTEELCLQESICDPRCDPTRSRVEDGDISVDSYEVTQVITHTFNTLGENFLQIEPPVDVSAGDILAIEEDGTEKGKVAVVDTDKDDDITKPHQAAAVGIKFIKGGGSAFQGRHMVQALVSYGSKTLLKYTFVDDPGVFPITVTITNNRGFGTQATNATLINLMEGIDFAIIEGPRYVATGDEAKYTVVPHTGDDVIYNWTLSSGVDQSSGTDPFEYRFTDSGDYNLSLTAHNALGEKRNVTQITVQDKIMEITLSTDLRDASSPSFLNISVSSGHVEKCVIDYGDKTPLETYIPDPPYSLEYNLTHIYKTIGYFTIVVTCSNFVSSNSSSVDVAILESITGLRLETSGSPADENFRVKWRVNSGSNIKFNLVLNGTSYAVDLSQSDAISYRWESVQIPAFPEGGYPYVLTATNEFGEQTINGTFLVMVPMLNPQMTSDLNDVTTDDKVTFTINLDRGSGVSIEVDFKDGSDNVTYSPPTATTPWTKPWVFKHMFQNGCKCRVTARIYNPSGTFIRSVEVFVKVGFSSFNWTLPSEAYYVLEPPANIEFKLFLNGPLPTSPTYTLDWDDGSPSKVFNTLSLSPEIYLYDFGDMGTYIVTLKMSNEFSTRVLSHKAIVIEKLVDPKITSEYVSAPINKSFDIGFSLNRGGQGNMTMLSWDLGDGKPFTVTERQGVSPNGVDTMSITYTTFGEKMITVNATAPLDQEVWATKTFDVINGINAENVAVNSDGDVKFGTPSSFTIQYNASTMPDNATIQIDWHGNGIDTSSIGFTISRPGENQSVSYTYLKDGVHKAKFSIFNDASRVELEAETGVYKSITNLRLESCYFLNSNDPTRTHILGLTEKQTIYPMDEPVYFNLVNDGNAFASAYDIESISHPAGGKVSETFDHNNFHVTFKQEGAFELKITARNPLASSNVSKDIEIVKRVKNLSVQSVGQVSPGIRNILNFSLGDFGNDTCVYIDWGDVDGSKTIYSNNMTQCNESDYVNANQGGDMKDFVENNPGFEYLKEGVYSINVTAKNAYGSSNIVIEAPVLYSVCSMPKLWIHNQETSIHYANQHKRSDIIRVLGLADISCADTFENSKKWIVEKVDANTGDPLSNPTINTTGLILSKAELYIPTRHLEFGAYKATYQMMMKDTTEEVTIASTAFTYFKIVSSSLVGVMVEGGLSQLTLGSQETLILEPLKWSFDPDLDAVSDQDLSVMSWECQTMDETAQSSCGQVKMVAGSKQTIEGSQLKEDRKYQVLVHLTKDNRNTTAQVIISVHGNASRQAFIKCLKGSVCHQKGDGYLAPQTSHLSLDCDCRDCTANAEYRWEIFTKDYRWPEGWKPIKKGRLLTSSISADNKPCDIRDKSWIISKSFALKKEFFSIYENSDMKYKAQCVVMDGEVVTKVATIITASKPPMEGTCSITPHAATATVNNDKQWQISCSGWKDEDGIKEYQISCGFADDSIEKEVTSHLTSSRDDSGFTLDVSLPVGAPYKNYEQDVYVYIRNSLNSVKKIKIAAVKVFPAQEEETRDYVESVVTNDKHPFYKTMHEGDQRSVCEQTTAMAIALGHSQTESEGEYADDVLVPNTQINTGYGPSQINRTKAFMPAPTNVTLEMQYAYEKLRENRAKLRTKMAKFVLGMAMDDITSIHQVTGALNEITARSTEVSIENQRTILAGLNKIISNIGDQVKMKGVPQEDTQKAITNIYSIIGSIIEASGVYGSYPTLTDMEATKEDSVWQDYETNGVDGDEIDLSNAGGSFEEAMRQHTLAVHKKIAAEKSVELSNVINGLLERMAMLFDGYAIPGQIQEATADRMKYRVAKNFVSDYEDKTIGLSESKASVTFPKKMSSMFSSEQVGSNESVTLQVLQGTNTAKRYTTKALEYLPIEARTHFVTVDFYNRSGNQISLIESNESNEPIKVTIPNDQNALTPEKRMILPLVAKWNQFMLHSVQIPSADSYLQISFEVENNTQLVVAVKFNEVPDPAGNGTDFVFVVPKTFPPDPNDVGAFSVVIDKEKADGRVGKWMFGVVERNASFINTPPPNDTELIERYNKGTGEFNGYNLTVLVSGCFHDKVGQKDWDTAGCTVSKETTFEFTVCLCTHLTTFAGGLIPVPSVIEWNFEFDQVDYMSNPTLHTTEIMIILLFVLGFLLARRRDVHDVPKRGLVPLSDNWKEDKYYYELTVATGLRQNAGTTSKVYFMLSGEEDKTEVRLLSDSKRDILKRGMTNGFLMAVPKCLGHLKNIRVWHDNSGKGKMGSWFPNYIAVRDLQTDNRHVFIVDRWLAVEQEDGRVDRIVPVATKEQLSQFSYLFRERSKRRIQDDHIWYSLVASPPNSRFTCVMRLACCMCLLFLQMFLTALFYVGDDTDDRYKSYDVGALSFSFTQIWIGFVSAILLLPFDVLLVFLFRRATSHGVVVKRSKDISIEFKDLTSRRSSTCTGIEETDVDKPSSSKDTVALASKSSMNGDTKETHNWSKIPHWFIIIAWIILALLFVLSFSMVTYYGVTFKVVVLAIAFIVFVKNGDREVEEEEVFIEDKKQDFLHPQSAFIMEARSARPPSAETLAKMREERLREVKMWSVIREVFFYLLFLWILLAVTNRHRGSENYHYKNSMYRTFVSSLDTKICFEEIKSEADFWLWAKTGLIGGLVAGSYYNNYPPLQLKTYINDKTSRILGHAVIRQNRIKPRRCDLPNQFDDVIPECNIQYNKDEEEKEDFDIGWSPFGSIPNGSKPEYKYASARSLDGYPYWGRRGFYSGGGYVTHLVGNKPTLLTLMNRLEKEHWIDRYTRSVFIEFTVYNPQVNLFSMNLLLAEFDATNGIITSHRFEPAMLLPYVDSYLIFQVICEITFLIYVAVLFVLEVRNIYHQRIRYFNHFWNWVEVLIIILAINAVIIYFYRLIETNKLTDDFKKNQGNDYIKFQYVSYWNELFSYFIGFIVFLVTLKFIKLLRFNRRVAKFSSTIRKGRSILIQFSIVAFILFIAFCQVFFLVFRNVSQQYSTFSETIVASILMMMGKFNIYAMLMVEPLLTPIFALCFLITMTFIILNMFISILNNSLKDVIRNVQQQSDDIQVIQFMMGRFQNWLGITLPRLPQDGPEESENDAGEIEGDLSGMPGTSSEMDKLKLGMTLGGPLKLKQPYRAPKSTLLGEFHPKTTKDVMVPLKKLFKGDVEPVGEIEDEDIRQKKDGKHKEKKVVKKVKKDNKPGKKSKGKDTQPAEATNKEQSAVLGERVPIKVEAVIETAGKVTTPTVEAKGKTAPPATTTKGKATQPSAAVKGKEATPAATTKGKEAPPAATAKGKEAPPAATTKGKEAPSAATTKGKEAPPVPTTKGKEAPPVPTTKGKEAPPVPTTKGKEAPPVPATKGKEAQQAATTKGKEAPPVPATKGKGAPSAATTKGKEAQQAATTKGKEATPAATTKGKEAPPAATTKGKEAIPAATTKGKEAPSVPATAGKGTPPADETEGKETASADKAIVKETTPVTKYEGTESPSAADTTDKETSSAAESKPVEESAGTKRDQATSEKDTKPVEAEKK